MFMIHFSSEAIDIGNRTSKQSELQKRNFF